MIDNFRLNNICIQALKDALETIPIILTRTEDKLI